MWSRNVEDCVLSFVTDSVLQLIL